MIALDQIVSPLSVDMPDAVKMQIEAMIDLANEASIAERLVRVPSQISVRDGKG